MISIFAPAKINLFLHVTGKRGDGYHALESLVMFADIGDEITLEPSDSYTLETSGPYAQALKKQCSEPNNLVTRTVNAICEAMQIAPHFKITLTKNLPLAAGIGGGSADAAAAAYAILRYSDESLSAQRLGKILCDIGADLPVCFHSATATMRGIGEKIGTIEEPKEPLYAILANPGIEIPTAQAFASINGQFSKPLDKVSAPVDPGFIKFIAQHHNDLQRNAQKMHEDITTLLDMINQQEGCQIARMSGSGATCFGIYKDAQSQQKAYESLRARYPDLWIVKTRLGGQKRASL